MYYMCATLVRARPTIDLKHDPKHTYRQGITYTCFVKERKNRNIAMKIIDWILIAKKWHKIIWLANRDLSNCENPESESDYPMIYAEAGVFEKHWDIIQKLDIKYDIGHDSTGNKSKNNRKSAGKGI